VRWSSSRVPCGHKSERGRIVEIWGAFVWAERMRRFGSGCRPAVGEGMERAGVTPQHDGLLRWRHGVDLVVLAVNAVMLSIAVSNGDN
jgi:hypothetical protein